MPPRLMFIAPCLVLAGCGGGGADDPRGVDRGETLLSVSASGHAESKPDKAEFQAGVETWARTAKEASAANNAKIEEIVGALRALGVPERDLQTRAVSVQLDPQRKHYLDTSKLDDTRTLTKDSSASRRWGGDSSAFVNILFSLIAAL